jgi:hypothetical protein
MSPHISDLTVFFSFLAQPEEASSARSYTNQKKIKVAHPTRSITTWIEQARSRTQSKEQTIAHYALLGNLRHKSPRESEFAKTPHGDDY